MADAPHPPPPWRLQGRVLVIPALVRSPAGAGGPPVLRGPGGRTLGGLLLGAYDARSTLAYHELLAAGGVIWTGGAPAAWITHAHVDDDGSIAGGRAIWGMPKLDGDFRWERSPSGERVTVSQAGRRIVTVSAARRPRTVTLPVAAPFAGRDGARRAWAAGRLRGTPVSVRVDLPPDSPLAGLLPRLARIAVVGDVSLRITAPRRPRSG